MAILVERSRCWEWGTWDVERWAMSVIDDPGLVKHFGQYVVSLGGIHYEGTIANPGKRHSFFVSGIVMTFKQNRVPFFVTAGHALEFLDREMSTRKFCDFKLIDYLGERATNDMAVPFDYATSQRFFFHEGNGLDFGVVHLTDHYHRLLKANQGDCTISHVPNSTFSR
jgi:hypothetical protein